MRSTCRRSRTCSADLVPSRSSRSRSPRAPIVCGPGWPTRRRPAGPLPDAAGTGRDVRGLQHAAGARRSGELRQHRRTRTGRREVDRNLTSRASTGFTGTAPIGIAAQRTQRSGPIRRAGSYWRLGRPDRFVHRADAEQQQRRCRLLARTLDRQRPAQRGVGGTSNPAGCQSRAGTGSPGRSPAATPAQPARPRRSATSSTCPAASGTLTWLSSCGAQGTSSSRRC